MKGTSDADENIVKINTTAWDKMCNYLKWSPGEVGGLLVIDDSDGILIEDLILPKQKVTQATVELDMVKIMMEIMNTKPELLKKIKGWFHTHPKSSCFWSGTDLNTTERLIVNAPYCISIVQSEYVKDKYWNKDKEGMYCLVKLSLKNPRIDFDGMNFVLVENGNIDVKKEKIEFDKKVKFVVWEALKKGSYKPYPKININNFIIDKEVEHEEREEEYDGYGFF